MASSIFEHLNEPGRLSRHSAKSREAGLITSMSTATFVSNSEKETLGLAVKIAANIKKNDCLALVGNFGSGKTVFVKGLARGLSTSKKTYVCSPSFVILKTYPGRLPIYHFDLYRLNHARDLENIGLFEFMSAGGVSVIEWADKIKKLLPKGCLRIEFFVLGPGMRSIKFCARAADLRRFLKRVKPWTYIQNTY